MEMREEKTVSLLLGSNLGDRSANLHSALQHIDERVGKVHRHSAIYETEAWGKEDQPSFLNMALLVRTRLSPVAVLNAILNIEKELGRFREEKWGARTIDIDILLYENYILRTPDLSIPHPEMQNRRFALSPLQELTPDAIHPIIGKSIADLLLVCQDPLAVKIYFSSSNE